jgi:hypothetical protein
LQSLAAAINMADKSTKKMKEVEVIDLTSDNEATPESTGPKRIERHPILAEAESHGRPWELKDMNDQANEVGVDNAPGLQKQPVLGSAKCLQDPDLYCYRHPVPGIFWLQALQYVYSNSQSNPLATFFDNQTMLTKSCSTHRHLCHCRFCFLPPNAVEFLNRKIRLL